MRGLEVFSGRFMTDCGQGGLNLTSACKVLANNMSALKIRNMQAAAVASAVRHVLAAAVKSRHKDCKH